MSQYKLLILSVRIIPMEACYTHIPIKTNKNEINMNVYLYRQ